ncbi:uncharacterized protein IUM83_01847 [Phytophthora cinnamomi]|uniref:uncharacterized protein n=1 Tax=Phytophthora cinnamomi TaxID=4785 RepID=UPI00355AA975|nr:hypothetical protein IUM83_01847 [Phytophthora cinnamomi]
MELHTSAAIMERATVETMPFCEYTRESDHAIYVETLADVNAPLLGSELDLSMARPPVFVQRVIEYAPSFCTASLDSLSHFVSTLTLILASLRKEHLTPTLLLCVSPRHECSLHVIEPSSWSTSSTSEYVESTCSPALSS